jgi:hypothetical protein
MHSAVFKTYVNIGDKEPKEMSIEYIPASDLLVFGVEGKELLNISFTDNLETIVEAIASIRNFQKFE